MESVGSGGSARFRVQQQRSGGSLSRDLDALPAEQGSAVPILDPVADKPDSAFASVAIRPSTEPSPPSTGSMLRPSPSLRNGKPDSFWARHREPVFDFIGVVILVVLLIISENLPAREVFITKATLYYHSYPYYENSVPSWTVPVIAFLVPIAVFFAYKFIDNRSVQELARLVSTLVVAVLLTATITNCLKIAVGRPRPNFVVKCWPDGNQVFSDETDYGGYAVCSAAKKVENEHRKSFPSGHASWTASGLGFLTYFLLGQVRAFSSSTHTWRIMFSIIPMLGAVAVGVSRVTDYWHHPSDVLTGLALGFGVSLIMYLQLYPWFWDESCDVSLYLQQRPRQRASSVNSVGPGMV